MIFMITGTGTDVGKTVATAALACRLPGTVHVAKPAQTGEPDGLGDLHTLQQLTGISSLHEFARFPDPLAPLTAAQYSGMGPLVFEDVVDRIRDLDSPSATVLVEGAGGALVELGLTRAGTPWTILDAAARLNTPLIIVTTTGLGSLNHAALTLEALQHRGLRCGGVIGGDIPTEPDLATRLNLEHFQRGLLPGYPAPWLGAIPHGAGQLSPEQFCAGATKWITVPN